MKKFFITVWNYLFDTNFEIKSTNQRRLVKNTKTNKLEWTKGQEVITTDKSIGKKEIMFSAVSREPFFKHRFFIEFPGIPEEYFVSYDLVNQECLKSLINEQDETSIFKVLLGYDENFDICNALENLPKSLIGDIKIKIVSPNGKIVKTICLSECKLQSVNYFENFDYSSDELIHGQIVIKHKKRNIY